jgi:hypothetical protein
VDLPGGDVAGVGGGVEVAVGVVGVGGDQVRVEAVGVGNRRGAGGGGHDAAIVPVVDAFGQAPGLVVPVQHVVDAGVGGGDGAGGAGAAEDGGVETLGGDVGGDVAGPVVLELFLAEDVDTGGRAGVGAEAIGAGSGPRGLVKPRGPRRYGQDQIELLMHSPSARTLSAQLLNQH